METMGKWKVKEMERKGKWKGNGMEMNLIKRMKMKEKFKMKEN